MTPEETIVILTEALRTIAFQERLDKRSMQLVARVALLKVSPAGESV